MLKRYYQQGFTLIEILVVLFIISIVSSVALLTISHNSNQQLANFTNELTEIMTLAEEQAMLQPIILGVSLKDRKLAFQSLLPNGKEIKWQPLHDKLLEQHAIPEDIQVGVEIGNMTASSEDDDNDNPQIVISTNGDITPFTIYVGKTGEKPRYMIVGDADGHVSSKLLS